jgi:antitoxin component YwqK of YwqJK toxin-antitoxin module
MDKVNGLMKGYQDGKLLYTNSYESDKSEGYYYDYHNNGAIASKVPFTNDQRHGIAEYYAPDSSLMYQFTYFENVLKSFSYKNATGKLVPKKPVTLQTSQVLCYYPNGKVSARISMKEGLYHGPFITYYPNGKIMQEKNFVNGDLEGSCKYYYANGKLKEFISYHNDERQGVYERYYENGQKHESGQFLAGQSMGEWKIYNQAGKQVNTAYFSNNEIYDFK